MKVHIGRSTGRSTPPSIKHRCLEYCNTNLADLPLDQILSYIYWLRMTIAHCYCYSLSRQINWQIYPPPPVLISSGQEWQFHIVTVTVPLHQTWQISWQIYPLSIKHRCLEYHNTKLGRSTGRSTPYQLSIDALSTITPNLADLLGDLPPINQA